LRAEEDCPYPTRQAVPETRISSRHTLLYGGSYPGLRSRSGYSGPTMYALSCAQVRDHRTAGTFVPLRGSRRWRHHSRVPIFWRTWRLGPLRFRMCTPIRRKRADLPSDTCRTPQGQRVRGRGAIRLRTVTRRCRRLACLLHTCTLMRRRCARLLNDIRRTSKASGAGAIGLRSWSPDRSRLTRRLDHGSNLSRHWLRVSRSAVVRRPAGEPDNADKGPHGRNPNGQSSRSDWEERPRHPHPFFT
jgi:hypothetical protein